MRKTGLVLSFALLFVASIPAATTGYPPRPGTTDSPLSESEEATLWSNVSDETYLTSKEYRDAYNENRTTIHDIANGSDLTFTEPPETAHQWTTYAHEGFEPGGASVSRYPPHADTESGLYIKEAHATVFAVSPSTKTHVSPGDERFYVPPEGTVRGLVDYRVALPPSVGLNETGERWLVDTHKVTETRLYADGEQIATGAGSHHPALDYRTEDVSTFRIEADIEVRLIREDLSNNPLTNESSEVLERELQTETITVSDEIDVELYDLRASVHFTEYPNGETGASIYQNAPWRGYTLDSEGETEVRGVWRFFTSRDTRWDELVESSPMETERMDSTTLPVYVHAYPSKLGPRAKPEYAGPTIVRRWGEEQASPQDELHENITVEVVTEPYEPTYGLAVRSRILDRNALTVHGIVRGTEAEHIEGLAGDREMRNSSLSADIIARNESGITVLLTLQEAETGDPIVLADDDRIAPIADFEREGYIEIDGQRVKTNATGEAVVHLSEQGVYTARYEPASWLDSYPVYAGDSAIVRWHALDSLDGWFELFRRGVLLAAPFFVVWYSGRRLGSIFQTQRYP